VCYGQGGSAPTVTDANVVLGYLNPLALAGGSVPIDAPAARQAVTDHVAVPLGRDLMETAFGIHLVANTNMMRAVKAVTTNRGRDTRDFVMFAFGGSGGVHAATLARELRIAQVVIPAAAGVFSALGLLFADSELNESRSFLRPLAAIDDAEAHTIYAELRSDISIRLERNMSEVSFRQVADLRYAGQAFELSIAVPEDLVGQARIDELGRRFDAEHQQRYGHNFEGQYSLEVVNLRLVGTVPSGNTNAVPKIVSKAEEPHHRQAYFGPEFGMLSTPVCERAAVSAQPMQGPMVIEEYEGTVVVPPYASVRLDPNGSLIIEIKGP
jgi:N-methylhydantoinase A